MARKGRPKKRKTTPIKRQKNVFVTGRRIL